MVGVRGSVRVRVRLEVRVEVQVRGWGDQMSRAPKTMP